jgi:16S rRNA C967 or C1407 C5-methylase (RsmB/RsmF family)
VDQRENEDQVDWFLSEHPGFERADSQKALVAAGVTLPESWRAFNDRGDLRLRSNWSNTDGFFGVLLTKKDPQAENPVGQ